MLDISLLRRDLDAVVARLQTRKNPQPFLDVDRFKTLEGERKQLQVRTEELQAKRNSLSKQIGMLKGKGQHAEADAVMAQVGALKNELDASAARLELIQAELQGLLLAVPNLPHESVPVGKSSADNPEVRVWGTPRTFDFEPKAHWDIGEGLGILDFDRATRMSGARARMPTRDEAQATTARAAPVTRGRLLTGHAFRHLGMEEPRRDASQFGLFAQDDDD